MAVDADEIQAKLRALRERYVAELPQKLQHISAGWTRLESDWSATELENFLRACHNLAGSGATFGFPELSAAARVLEEQLRGLGPAQQKPDSGRLLVLKGLVQELDAAVQATLMDSERNFELFPVLDKPLAAVTAENRLIYLAEDDAHSAAELALQLRRYGYEVIVFPSPTDLPAAVIRRPPAAVLMDIVFPEGRLSGVEVVGTIQRSREQRLPVMFVSSRDDLEARLQAVRGGGMAYFTKPVDAGDLVDKLDALIEQRPEEAYRVLVIDDSQPLAAYYGAVLEEHGMEVEVLSELTDFIKILDQFRPDLILLDLYMPACDGVELATVIRQKDEFVSTPIVYLSAETDIDTQLQALIGGGDDFLTKPIQPRHLIASVRNRVRRARELRGFMVRDGLTGLLNHTTIKEQLELELARCIRERRSMSFAMLDIDLFKQVNDRYGHVVGDRVIKGLARLLRDRLRASDVIGRYGGEEFAVVLTGTDPESAARLLNGIREDFAALQYVSDEGPFNVSFSGGIASLPGYTDAARMNEAADKALYEAKRAGRNRILLADAEHH